jgi:Fur family ferric uptake transcriptional regulator
MNKANLTEKRLNNLLEALFEKGMRRTLQKTLLLKAMIELDHPATVDDIHRKMGKKTCDRVTLYRSIQQLEKHDLVTKVFESGSAMYSLKEANKKHQHFIQCIDCKIMTPINFCVLEGQTQLIEKMGFREIKHRLEFFGRCSDC